MIIDSYKIIYHYNDGHPWRKYSYLTRAVSKEKAVKDFRDWNTHGIIDKVINLSERCRKYKEEKKMDLTKKITVELTEDDIKEIVAEYVKNNANIKGVTAENVELVYGVKYSGPQMDRVEHGYLKECRVKC